MDDSGKWIRPYYIGQDNMVDKFGFGIFRRESSFCEDIEITKKKELKPIKKAQNWDGNYKHQLYQKDLR